MTVDVKAPDGSVVRFPDGTSDDTITTVMAREYGRPQTFGQRVGDLFTGSRRTEHPNAEEFGVAASRGGIPVEEAMRQPRGRDPQTFFEHVRRALGSTEFDAPPPVPGGQPTGTLGAIARSGITPDPEAQFDILKRNIPDLERQNDRHGNIMLRSPSMGVTDWTYLNRPGMSGRDWDEFATQFLATLPFGAAVGLGRTFGTRAAIGATALGSSSVAQDVAAGAMGSQQGIDPTRALISGGIGAAAGPLTGWLAGRTPGTLAGQRAIETAEDLAAHERLGVRPFGPGFSSQGRMAPMAALARQVAETPIMGRPVRTALDESIAGAGAAARRIADDIAPTASTEQTGLVMQQGLNRYRAAGVADLEPDVVRALGIAPYSPTQSRSFMSAGAARRAEEADAIRQAQGEVQNALTSRGVTLPSARALNQIIRTRTTAEDLSDDALNRLIRAPSAETSFAARQEGLYESAWRRVPALFKSNDAANPNLLRAVNTNNAFRQITGFEEKAGVSGGIASGRFADMAERVKTNTTLASLRAMRTEIGRALSNFGLFETGLDSSQLRTIYGALSRDIEIGVQDLANRARILAHQTGDRALLGTAQEANRALFELRRADRYTRLGLERMDQFAKLVGSDNPQAVIGTVLRAAMDGTKGNVRMLRTAMAALRPEERNQVSSLALHGLGRPSGSAGGIVQEVAFSPNTFMTNYRNMLPEARNIIFGPDHADALDDLVRVASRLDDVLKTTNWSRSGTNAINMSMLAGGIGFTASGDLLTPLAIGGGGLMASYLLSRPAYVRWATQYARLRAEAPARLTQHIARLASMSQRDPLLLPFIRSIQMARPDDERHGRNPDPTVKQ